LGFTKSEVDPNLYLLQVGKEPLILVLYVDDLFLTGGEKLITRCKIELASDFKMKNVGLMHYLLGLEVWQQPDEIFLEHGKYAVEILRRFGMMDCKSMITPMTTNLNTLGYSYSDLVDPTIYMQLIGSLMYLVNTRRDIFFVVNTLSQFMVESRQVHWVATKQVLRYLWGTIGFGLRYVIGDGVRLHGYSGSYWEGSVVDLKSTSGGSFSLGSTVLSWFSRKPTSMELGST
jgi:hypothetical protein